MIKHNSKFLIKQIFQTSTYFSKIILQIRKKFNKYIKKKSNIILIRSTFVLKIQNNPVCEKITVRDNSEMRMKNIFR